MPLLRHGHVPGSVEASARPDRSRRTPPTGSGGRQRHRPASTTLHPDGETPKERRRQAMSRYGRPLDGSEQVRLARMCQIIDSLRLFRDLHHVRG